MAIAPVLCAQEDPEGKLAFFKDGELYVAKLDGSGLAQLTHDGVDKGEPHWSPDGKRLAYFLPLDRSRAIARLGVINADGTEAHELLFHPVGPVVIGGMRFVEVMRWLDKERLVLDGSINPNNCEYSVVDAATGKEVRGYIGACNTFVDSPDGAHVAYSAPPGIGVQDEDYRRCISIDNTTPYRPESKSGRLLTDAVWSADSTTVAAVEHDLVTKEKGVVVVTRSRAVTRVPLPMSIEGTMSLRWVGPRLILEAGENRYQVDITARALRFAGADVDDQIAAEAAAKRLIEEARYRHGQAAGGGSGRGH